MFARQSFRRSFSNIKPRMFQHQIKPAHKLQLSAICSKLPPAGHLRFLGSSSKTGFLAVGTVLEGNDESLEAIINNNSLVLVDFYADWCSPCRMLTPVLVKAVEETKTVVLVKVNVDDSQKMAQKYQITSLPTVALFKDGKMLSTFVGSRNKEFVKEFIASGSSS